MGMPPGEPVREASVWKAADVAGDEAWVYRFTDADLEELDAAVESIRAQALGACGFRREDFPLPRLGPRIAGFLHELEHGRGFVLLRGLSVERYDEEALWALYWGLGVHLGQPITQNAQGERIVRVTDHGDDYGAANVRGHRTRFGILPHCDSADMVGLLCVRPAGSGGASTIASSAAIHNEILVRHPEYLDVLYRGFRINLAGKGPTGTPEEVTQNAIPVFSRYRGRISCRFNQKQIEDGAAATGTALTALERDAISSVGSLALSDTFRLDMDFLPGDIQLLNNHAILHSRQGFTDHPEPERKRLLLRLWVNVPEGRALAPEFADRLNSGPRGGVTPRRGARP